MTFSAIFALGLVAGVLAMFSRRYSVKLALALFSLFLMGAAVGSAQEYANVPPPSAPTASDTAIFNAHATHDDCQYAIQNQHSVNAKGGTVMDWKWVAVGWKMCGAELRLHKAPAAAIHVTDYMLVRACDRLAANDPNHVILACMPV